jgi:hypothetical protein
VTAENQFTDSVELYAYFNVSISGTWTATITAQRSFDKGSTWFDVKTWTANVQEYGLEPEKGVYYRIGVKSGAFTNGAAVLRISQ